MVMSLWPRFFGLSCRYFRQRYYKYQLPRATESCCRQSLAIIMINYTAVERRTSEVLSTYQLSSRKVEAQSGQLTRFDDTAYRCPEFTRKFHRDLVPLFFYMPEFPYNTVYGPMIGRKKPPCQNQLDFSSRFDKTPICD